MHPRLPHVCKTNSFDTDSFPFRHCARVYYAPIASLPAICFLIYTGALPRSFVIPLIKAYFQQTVSLTSIMEAHKILGIPVDASEERVRIAFKALVCTSFVRYSTRQLTIIRPSNGIPTVIQHTAVTKLLRSLLK